MKTNLLIPGKFYHVFNIARNREPLFRDEESFRFFLKLYLAHICPVAETYAYCLLRDHLHLLIRIREDASGSLFKPFALLFNSYSKGCVKKYQVEGKLFRFKLKRREIRSERQLCEMIRYVNQNPWRHRITEHPSDYRFSSFRATVTLGPTMVAKEQVINCFGSREILAESLLIKVEEEQIRGLILED